MRFSLLFLALAAVLLMAATPSASTSIVSCSLSSLTISDADGQLYQRSSFGLVPSYVFQLPSISLSTVSVQISYVDPPAVERTLRVFLNNTLKTTTAAVNPSAQVITGLSTVCGQSNTLRINPSMSIDDEYVTESCSFRYIVTLVNRQCGVTGDPQFAGLRGQSYQVHGIDGAVYSLISAPEYLINSRFQFLDGPRPCPSMPTTGRKSVACWSHPGSYLGSVGALTSSGQSIELQSGPADTGFSAVLVDGRELAVGDVLAVTSSQGTIGSIVRNSTHEVTLNIGAFDIELENNDMFVNLRAVRVLAQDWKKLAFEHVHGLLGQTWQSRRYAGAVKEIEGEVDDYVITEDSLHGYGFVFNQFNGVRA